MVGKEIRSVARDWRRVLKGDASAWRKREEERGRRRRWEEVSSSFDLSLPSTLRLRLTEGAS